jgi:hypothetical protein
MASSDFESTEYDLSTTSVRVIRAASIVQAVFSNKLEAKYFYSEISSRFKREADKFRGGTT